MSKQPKAVVEVTAHDVQGPGVVACPNPKMALWSNHPKVFIDVAGVTQPAPAPLPTQPSAVIRDRWEFAFPSRRLAAI